MIPSQTIDEIKERAGDSIVDIIGRYTKLSKSGSNRKGLCPYHDEKTPSFTVNETRSFFKCFGCGQSGDAVQIVMDMEGLTYIEAIRSLADILNIAILEEKTSPSKSAKKPQCIKDVDAIKVSIRKAGYCIVFFDKASLKAFTPTNSTPYLLSESIQDIQAQRISNRTNTVFIKASKSYASAEALHNIQALLRQDLDVYVLSGNTEPNVRKDFSNNSVRCKDSPEWITYILKNYDLTDSLRRSMLKTISVINDDIRRSVYMKYFSSLWQEQLNRQNN